MPDPTRARQQHSSAVRSKRLSLTEPFHLIAVQAICPGCCLACCSAFVVLARSKPGRALLEGVARPPLALLDHSQGRGKIKRARAAERGKLREVRLPTSRSISGDAMRKTMYWRVGEGMHVEALSLRPLACASSSRIKQQSESWFQRYVFGRSWPSRVV